MKNSKMNSLVGRKVRIDWPCRWVGARIDFIDQLKSDAAKEPYFGQAGEIVAYDLGEDKPVVILLDSTRQIVSLPGGAITVTGDVPPDETADLLRQIISEIKTSNRLLLGLSCLAVK